jgi:hypothetical protein
MNHPLTLKWFLAFGNYELRWLKEVQLATNEQLELCHENRLYQIGQFLQHVKTQTGKMMERVLGHLEHAIRLATEDPGMLFRPMHGVAGVALLEFFLRIKLNLLGARPQINTKGWILGPPECDGIYWMVLRTLDKEDKLSLVMVEHKTNSVIISNQRNLYLNSPVIQGARFWRVESI